ncbi:MAG: fumarate hydratase [Tannerellaceae bacterium]|nr:fumarate hydratase [Tannerellaceae bacterium]
MMKLEREEIIDKVKNCLITAATTFSEDKKAVYHEAIKRETVPGAKWVLETILQNALVAEQNRSPLCDDTGIPHLFLEVGPTRNINGQLINFIHEGIREGLRDLPGRPMAINGNDLQRIDQSGGLNVDPGALLPSPILIKPITEDVIRLHILMHGGGPEIRSKTFRVFHKHKVCVVTDEIIDWAVEGAGLLGCSPVSLAIGIGRSHFEAASLMMEAMVYGNHNIQSEIETEITERVNQSKKGPLGLGGQTTVLGTFLRIGPQRASGVRIVSLRPCCCFEPRKASVTLS